MHNKPFFWSILGGMVIGFAAGVLAYPFLPTTAHAQQEKKQEKKTVVQQLERINGTLSSRNHPVAEELRNIEEALSDRRSPVVQQLEDLTEQLDELSDIKRDIEKIERHMD